MPDTVLTLREINADLLTSLLKKFKLEVITVEEGRSIPGSYWGDSEAGLIANKLYTRNDTPIHSILHEACHYICMDDSRRSGLETDAGGDYDEENAVCYLQILLADHIEQVGSQRMMQDMDSWGYTFRLGSAEKWFKEDADDARQWLIEHEVINSSSQLSFNLNSC